MFFPNFISSFFLESTIFGFCNVQNVFGYYGRKMCIYTNRQKQNRAVEIRLYTSNECALAYSLTCNLIKAKAARL